MLSAGSVQKSLEYLSKEKVDLILLDVNLPDGSGFQLCRKLRAERNLKAVSVYPLRKIWKTSIVDSIRHID